MKKRLLLATNNKRFFYNLIYECFNKSCLTINVIAASLQLY